MDMKIKNNNFIIASYVYIQPLKFVGRTCEVQQFLSGDDGEDDNGRSTSWWDKKRISRKEEARKMEMEEKRIQDDRATAERIGE